MKKSYSLFLVLSLLLCRNSFSQSIWKTLPFNEVAVSGNYLYQWSEEVQVGGGFGLYRCYRLGKIMTPVFGFEYNYTRCKESELQIGYSAKYIHPTLNFHNVHVPFSLRFHLGNKLPVFIETGIYANIMVGGNITGNVVINYHDTIGRQREKLYGSGAGVFGGIGIEIPNSYGTFILKMDITKGTSCLYHKGDIDETPLYNDSFLRVSVIYRI